MEFISVCSGNAVVVRNYGNTGVEFRASNPVTVWETLTRWISQAETVRDVYVHMSVSACEQTNCERS